MTLLPVLNDLVRRSARRGGRVALATSVAAIAAFGAPPVHATDVGIGADGGPVINAGPVVIYPSFQALVQHTSNLLYRPPDGTVPPEPTWIKVLSPGLALEFPFSHSSVTFGYNLATRNYGQVGSQWIDTNTALFDMQLEFGNGVFFLAHDEYRNGILDIPVGVPNSEVPFRNQKYRTNAGVIAVGHEREGYHRFSFQLRPVSTTYQRPLVAPYFNESSWSLEADGDWRVSPQSWFLWDVTGGTTDMDRPPSLVGGPADVRTEKEIGARFGTRRELSRGVILQFLLGFEWQSYAADFPSTFRGPVGSVAAQNTAATGVRWGLNLSRNAFPSVYENNNYFVSDQLTARAEVPPGPLLRFGGSAAYYRNTYPTDPGHRLDKVFGLEAWGGVRQGVWVEWRLLVRYDVRSSTLPNADYTTVQYGVAMVVGR